MAPSASDADGSGTIRSGSKSSITPSPWHSRQAPCGELNEKARGVSSGMLMPQAGHARRREKSRSPPPRVLMMTTSSASVSANSMASVSRRSAPARATRRSTTTSIEWFRRRSSENSSSSERTVPSTRTRVNPRARRSSSSLRNAPFRPRTIGASTFTRSVGGWARIVSTIRSTDWDVIASPHDGQCGTPILANSSLRKSYISVTVPTVDRGLDPVVRCSMEMAGERPSI